MKEYNESGFAGHVDAFCERMVAEAQRTKQPHFFIFNDIRIEATPESTGIELANKYRMDWNLRAEAHRNSSEGKAAAENNSREVLEAQASVDELIEEMYKTNSTEDMLAVLKKITPLSDRIGVIMPIGTMTKFFFDRGYTESMNCGDNFKEDDKENFAGWIVGQAISMMNHVGAIHSMVETSINKWEAKFKL